MAYLSGEPRQSKLGAGPSTILQARTATSGPEPALALADVDAVLGQVAGASGSGAAAQRRQLLGELLSRATSAEQAFLIRLLFGELRQGALEALVLDAVALAAALPATAARRAAMLAGNLAAWRTRRCAGRGRTRSVSADVVPARAADARATRGRYR